MGPLDTLDSHALRVLNALLCVETPVTGRALARILDLSQSTTQRTLARLREAGLVIVEQAPPALLYRVNPGHLAMPALTTLLRLDALLRERLVEELAAWRHPPAAAVAFGSVPTGRATPASDLDILIVRPDAIEPDEARWQAQLAELAERVHNWTGRRASVIEMSMREAREGMAHREPFLVEADRDGWVIAGPALHDLAGVPE